MSARRPSGFFRGSELGALLSMGGMLVVVLALILASRQWPRAPERPAPRPAAELPPLPPPDPAPELQGIQDRAPMNARDTAAFKLLMDRVRRAAPAALHAKARRELVYSQFFDNPERYRGLPVHVTGRARRVLAQEADPGSVVFPDGRFFEVYVITPDSQHNPYILVCDDVPPDLPIGDELDRPVAFDGYFLKLLAYRAGDETYRAAPLIVGRFAISATPPAPEGRPAAAPNWPLILAAVLGVLILIRLGLSLARLFSGTGRSIPPTRSTVINEIEPEALSAWIEQAQQGERRAEVEDDGEPEDRRW